MTARRGLAVALASVALAAAACGIPIDEDAKPLSQDGHEEALGGAPTTTATTAPADDPFLLNLYFVGPDNKLEVVQRPYSEGPTINDVLHDLEVGPTPEELDQVQETLGNLKTLIPPGLSARLNGRDIDRGVQFIMVDPSAMLRQRLDDEPANARVAVKQIVCTVLQALDDELGLRGVEIYDGDEILPLTDDNAQPLDGPATLEDFSNCRTGTEERNALLEAEESGENTTTT